MLSWKELLRPQAASTGLVGVPGTVTVDETPVVAPFHLTMLEALKPEPVTVKVGFELVSAAPGVTPTIRGDWDHPVDAHKSTSARTDKTRMVEHSRTTTACVGDIAMTPYVTGRSIAVSALYRQWQRGPDAKATITLIRKELKIRKRELRKSSLRLRCRNSSGFHVTAQPTALSNLVSP